ncbi:MAG TPA: sensor histidine kinase, partial [Kribbella sp.]|nr:sensor histidine kinase [Kribbella sp.]
MGLRGKLGLIFLLVSALAILVLCVAVYTQAQSARLDRTRSFADERIQLAAQSYDTNTVAVFGAKLDDPELPPQLRD